MLNKHTLKAGDRIIVNDVIKTGLPPAYGGSEPKEHLSFYTGMVGGMAGGEMGVGPGVVLVIVKPPRKVDGINLCRIKVDGRVDGGSEGEAYWCELRASCRHA